MCVSQLSCELRIVPPDSTKRQGNHKIKVNMSENGNARWLLMAQHSAILVGATAARAQAPDARTYRNRNVFVVLWPLPVVVRSGNLLQVWT
jgi:hypothetical protein